MTRPIDVLIVGAGPAGMAAAVAASEHGRSVTVIDDNQAPGGQIWRGFTADGSKSYPGAKHLADLIRRLPSQVEMRCGTRVVGVPSPGFLRVEDERDGEDLAYQKLILATGARERFLPFPGWTIPGVMGAGGVQALVKSGLAIQDKRVVVAGSGPLLPAVAAGLAAHGARIVGIYEQASRMRLMRFALNLVMHPSKVAEGLRYRSATLIAPYRTNSWIVRAHGRDRLQSITVKIAGTRRELGCDYLACGFHLVPNLELPRLLGCALEDGYVRAGASQQTSVMNVYCAGEPTGIGGLEKSLCEGEIAGLACAGKSTAHLLARQAQLMRFARRLDAAFAPRTELAQLADAETLVCRCEDVPRSALEPCRNWREAKLHARCGMGPCQGRVCGPATELLFGWKQDSVRPPVAPARVATVAARTAQRNES